ncbi:peptidoglycan DD-metalloendopeptidase family protein [Ascidiimonas sp. W6]|uniref:peptidoglycan DD-metalloendopeptidase family protein n=1 Tax=Ascidiimonas meishanensis TaxID=3128903 RepID=UPI0030EE26B5
MNSSFITRFKQIFTPSFIAPLNKTISRTEYIPIDLSSDNPELVNLDMSDPDKMESYIKEYLIQNNGQVAYGGYLEKRNLYKSSALFQHNSLAPRNIHLGVDFWSSAGTQVITPLDGVLHSFNDNSSSGDYGPTIILEHKFEEEVFYTLYGHLSKLSLEPLYIGKTFKAGDLLGTLGRPQENVNYAPHLHFQLILDLEGRKGDYPGVCSNEDKNFFYNNCPNPTLVLAID